MKKYFFKITAVVLLIGLISSCDEKQVMYDGDPVVALFASDFSQLNVLEGTNGTAQIGVNVSALSTADRKFVISVDSQASTASPDQYTIANAATLFIPANSYTGYIKVDGIYETLPEDRSPVSLVLDLLEVGDAIHLDAAKTTYTLNIKRSCKFDTNTIGTNFTGSSSVDGEFILSFKPVMTQGTANPNKFTLNTLWGENFVAEIIGSPSYNGYYPNPGTILINDDLTLTIRDEVGTIIPDTSGFYDPCANTFNYTTTLTLNYQDGTSDEYTVNVVLTPN